MSAASARTATATTIVADGSVEVAAAGWLTPVPGVGCALAEGRTEAVGVTLVGVLDVVAETVGVASAVEVGSDVVGVGVPDAVGVAVGVGDCSPCVGLGVAACGNAKRAIAAAGP
ncbi:hypothetical protein ACPPVT_12575 [Angustibacter sp. McL0619]|uniref:hypothetical protein n=1 Tax=Angustibacter sp. McL0619 TaxID=3415676 RepID=UPI003CEDDBF1